MSFRPRFLSGLVAIFAFVGAATQLPSCTLDPYGTQPTEVSKPCAADVNCDDQNPCTIDVCQSDSTCMWSNATDGPLTEQVAGDCRRDDCVDGQLVSVNDDADILDDSESCTTDGCNSGTPVHEPVSPDTMCAMGTSPGKCVEGVCTVECSPTEPCNDNNPCTEDTCNAGVGVCTFAKLDGLPTPGFQEPVGDCKIHICDNGVDAPLNDDADVPDDMNSCTQNLCAGGVGSNPGVAEGTPCVVGQPEVCNGQGGCVQCNVPDDCVLLPTDDDCQKRTCINNMCGQTFTAMGTPIANQTAGDCKQVVCNGTGATVVEILDADVPDDNNPCTQNNCAAGVPSNPNETAGFSCGNPLVCNGSGLCVGCNEANDCTMLPPTDFCKERTCVNSVCVLKLTPAGTDLPMGQTSEDCKVIECDAVGNIVTSVDPNDKPVDDNQCSQDVCSGQGVPSNPPEPVNTACMQTGGTVCNGAGDCKKANSATCGDGMECLSGFCVDGVCCNATCGENCKSCTVPGSIGMCVNVPKGTEDLPACTNTFSCDGAGGCKKDDAQGCSMAADCVSNFCIDGVCCASACTAACRSCNIMGSVGVCTPITSGEDITPANICNGTKSCDASGACKLKDSQPCSLGTDCVSGQCFDGVCCNVSCSGTCKSCNIPGAVGICSNIASGQDDANGVPACSGANESCDGMGTCKKEIARACATNAECLSGFCADNVCCNAACSGTCQACNLSGSIGTCGNVAAGQDDANAMTPCTGTKSCDGSGACKSELGVACSLAAECLSSSCVDGFCCNTGCTDTCKSCGLSGALGVCSNIPAGQDDNNPTNTCSGAPQSCDGNGSCKKENGQSCSMVDGSECLSGFCTDGVCCNIACGGTNTSDCQACSTAAGAAVNGTCAMRSMGTQCRGSAGMCDVAESCDGTNAACPVDAKVAMGTQCRASAGICDVAESCDGTNVNCPADGKAMVGTSCRASAGLCDVAESCDGMNVGCPADTKVAMGVECRGSAGLCDVAESCDGMNVGCPADTKVAMGVECRGAAGLCDVAEACDGMSAACPSDTKVAMGVECRGSAGLCDIAEACDGSSAACPSDTKVAMGVECRGSAGACDIAEACDGSNPACPADAKVAMGTQCRAAMGVCDVSEACDGTSVACPADGVAQSTVECRSIVGNCDVAEFCDGAAKTCPTDVLVTAGTLCRPDAGVCDVAENCDGMVGTCPTNSFEPANTVCAPVSCTGNTQTNADTCNATGMCVDNMTTDCSPFVCGATTCLSMCAADADCVSGFYCSSGACLMQAGLGAVCDNGNECTSGNCVDGFCCNSDCTGTCQACNVAGLLGTCSNVVAGDDDADATTPCTGTTEACDGAGACKKDIGVTCVVSSECAENSCADGYCCDGGCSGLCEACSTMKKGAGANGICGPVGAAMDPDNECDDAGVSTCGTNGFCDGAGACQLYAMGTTCTPASCSMNQAQPVELCNGTGACVDVPPVPCSPFICGATACLDTCTVDTDCQTGYFCSSGSCVLPLADGLTCDRARMCESGSCVDDVCCNNACAGLCQTCLAAQQAPGGTNGTCGPIDVGLDPADECAGATTCDGAGMCN